MVVEVKESPWIEAKKRSGLVAKLLSQEGYQPVGVWGETLSGVENFSSFYISDHKRNVVEDPGFLGRLFAPNYNLSVCLIARVGTDYELKTSIRVYGREYLGKIENLVKVTPFPVELTLEEEKPKKEYPNHEYGI